VGTLEVMAKKADESDKAVAKDITMLAEPGPVEVKVTTGLCLTR
jgi:hypothetical protein